MAAPNNGICRMQIEADVSGVIKSIRIQNGEPVEFGQTLFVIDQRQGD